MVIYNIIVDVVVIIGLLLVIININHFFIGYVMVLKVVLNHLLHHLLIYIIIIFVHKLYHMREEVVGVLLFVYYYRILSHYNNNFYFFNYNYSYFYICLTKRQLFNIISIHIIHFFWMFCVFTGDGYLQHYRRCCRDNWPTTGYNKYQSFFYWLRFGFKGGIKSIASSFTDLYYHNLRPQIISYA